MSYDRSVQCYLKGFNCAQAIVSTYCNELGLDSDTALKISCGFGAGMGYMGETCGAVTGAFMLIGLKHGRVKIEDNAGNRQTHQLIREFITNFEAVNGSIRCKDLLACDISTAEGLQTVRDKKLFETICPKLVEDSARIVTHLLDL